MIEIKTGKIKNTSITVPGSKSYTHRLLIAAALSNGDCFIENMLKSEDTLLTLNALNMMGIKTENFGNRVQIMGLSGKLKPCQDPIFLGNSGTSMRLLTGVAALGQGTYTLTGTNRMHERPIGDLLAGMNQIGITAKSVYENGYPPVEITGGNRTGGKVDLKCDISSQYLSSLLLIAPCLKKGLEINITKGPVSKPYIDMTIDILNRLGVKLERNGYIYYKIPGNQNYLPGNYMVEPDCSQAGYFWAAAAITGASIKVNGVTKNSRQGDVGFVDVLEQMGCNVVYENDGITVTGGVLSGIEIDMSNMPDIVPTLSVVASFAKGKTIIRNIAHLKAKESDRISSVVIELTKMGIDAMADEGNLLITGGNPRGAEIETYEDHRMAMSFSIAGLVVPNVRIKNENCVDKSFPNYWEVFERLYQ